MGLGFGKKGVDKYFLEESQPYTKRRPIKVRNVAWAAAVFVLLFFGVTIFLGPDPHEGQDAFQGGHNLAEKAGNAVSYGPSGSNNPQDQGNPFGGFQGLEGSGYKPSSGSGNARNRSAAQVIRRGANGNDPGSQLPMGSTLPVKLINAIRSGDSGAPVIAEVTQDIVVHGTTSIPATTRVIGQASYMEGDSRMQVRFHTFVYPEGDQHPVQGIAMMADGSPGLEGDEHSGVAKRQFGLFLGNFIGGMAQGMKERTSSGQIGLPYEVGSLKNGVLSGVALSAEDQTKSISDSLSQTKPFMTLPAGQGFILFLEQAYMP